MAEEPVDVLSPTPPVEEEGFAPFLPSQALALGVLAASGEEGDLGERVTVPPEGPYVPVWEERDVLEQLRRRLSGWDISPDGNLDTAESALVERTRHSIGTRVDRLLANLAFRATARDEHTVAVSEDGQFRAPIRDGLITVLLLDPVKAAPVLAQLHHELSGEARAGHFGGDWGRLTEEGGSLFFTLGPSVAPRRQAKRDGKSERKTRAKYRSIDD